MGKKMRRILYLSGVAIMPLFLWGTGNFAHASRTSSQVMANHQSIAIGNQRNRLSRTDGRYWTNRVNLAAYSRRQYRYPDIGWNARDLGGYYAGHGLWTRSDRVFRGNTLHRISAKGIQDLKRLGIHEVIDLRSYHHQGGSDPQENRYPNGLGVIYREYPVNTYAQKRSLYRAKRLYGGEIYKYGAPFTLYWHARNAYRQVFNDLLKNKTGAIYFHCIDGRDRTGIMGALYLSALGINRYTIYNDFLLTNYYKYKHSYRNQVAELNRFFGTVNRYYGNVHNYFLKGLGLTNHQLNQLKKMYLVKK